MEKLYKRATLIQGQLDPIYKHDVHLIEVLADGIREEPFYMFVDRMGTAKSAHSFFQGCLDAIAKQADMERIALKQQNQLGYTAGELLRQTEPTHHVDSPTSLNTVDAKSSAAHYQLAMLPNSTLNPIRAVTTTYQPAMPSTVSMKQETEPRGSESLLRAMFSQAGRRYGANQPFRKLLTKNPIGRDGKIML